MSAPTKTEPTKPAELYTALRHMQGGIKSILRWYSGAESYERAKENLHRQLTGAVRSLEQEPSRDTPTAG